MATPLNLDFATTNRLVNPRAWQQAQGRLIPADKTGPSAVAVTNITPLYLTITLDEIRAADPGDPATPTRYLISVEKQAATKRDQQKKRPYLTKVGEKNDSFQLRDIAGPPDNPTNLVLILADGETVNISKEKPFKRIDGYMASMYYEPQKKAWRDQRVGQPININGEDYKIVAISKDEVVLSAASNQKHWPIKLSSPPS
jgi:hypothetical protein